MMNRKPEFKNWNAEMNYYTLTSFEMKHSAFPEDEDLYIRKSRSFLVRQMILVLTYLRDKGLLKEYVQLRDREFN